MEPKSIIVPRNFSNSAALPNRGDARELFRIWELRATFPLPSYTFDVVRWRKDRVRLVDFNPFGEVTDGIFFSWEELLNNNFRSVV